MSVLKSPILFTGPYVAMLGMVSTSMVVSLALLPNPQTQAPHGCSRAPEVDSTPSDSNVFEVRTLNMAWNYLEIEWFQMEVRTLDMAWNYLEIKWFSDRLCRVFDYGMTLHLLVCLRSFPSNKAWDRDFDPTHNRFERPHIKWCHFRARYMLSRKDSEVLTLTVGLPLLSLRILHTYSRSFRF